MTPSAPLAETDGARPLPYRRSADDPRIAAHARHRVRADAARWRRDDPECARWAVGQGPIAHDDETQLRVRALVTDLAATGHGPDAAQAWAMLRAADRLACAAMWTVVHMTYAQRVRLDGAPLETDDFKPTPEGHTGGSLNMVPAYVGYLLANALTGRTRSWLMGQGHCVAAIDAVNVLLGNLHPEQAQRYDRTEAGLSRLCADFYSYALTADGRPAAPLGSHVNAHTAGGLIEGGYLGFAELQYVHMPLPGETLVAFLSDGAFEEQRGADWAPRWWRAADSGSALPVMILNGRRIEQRTGLVQDGGVAWLLEHLRLNGFDPFTIDGTDPAAFAWAILEAEARLTACAQAAEAGELGYPAPLHYIVAQAPKGFGFPGAGTNLAHNLPLGDPPPSRDASARERFNAAAAALYVPPAHLDEAVQALSTHTAQRRLLERDHPLARRDVCCQPADTLPWLPLEAAGTAQSAMRALDAAFLAIVEANPALRVRVGNPDEMRSNGMGGTLDHLGHRAADPEPGVAERSDGAVITALNEEAVVSAALANKGGLNLVVSYEAFAVKMLGAARQELTFARQQAAVGRPPRWLSVPLVLTSHTWENGKNELSHQDPTLAEAWLGEGAERARVVFPPDANAAIAALDACYATQGQLWTMVVPKRPVPARLSDAQARQLMAQAAIRLVGQGGPSERIALLAIGAYQLEQVLRASDRLAQRDVAHAAIAVLEPARLRMPRDSLEAAATLGDAAIASLLPEETAVRVVLSHTRPEPVAGVLRRIDTGPRTTRFMGFINRGGTLDTFGMLFANRCTWAHVLLEAANASGVAPSAWLTPSELDAATGRGDPSALR